MGRIGQSRIESRRRALPLQQVHADNVASGSAPLSQGIRSGNLLFVSGQIPRGRDGQIVRGDFAAEVRCVLSNVQAILEAGGSSVDRVCRVGVYLTDAALFAEFNRIYREFFTTEPLPARTAVICQLANPEIRVEVDAVAEAD